MQRKPWASVGPLLAWGVAVLAVGMTAARWIDIASTPVVLMQSVSPLAVPLCLLGLAGALLPGRLSVRVGLAAVCGPVLALHAFVWAPWLTDEAPAPGRRLTLMTVNLFHGRADTDQISRHVRTHGVDVLVLTEVRNTADRKLRADGVYARLPHSIPRPRTAGTTLIRSSLPLAPVPGRPGDAEMPARNPAAVLQAGGSLVLRGVHPFPPTPRRVRQWRTSLAELTEWAQRTPGPLVMAGDFNASVDHPGMRQLLAGGLRDAHEVAGEGRPVTWPNGRSVPAFVHLDHVLVRGVGVESVEEVRIPGTDHDAILAGLVLPDDR